MADEVTGRPDHINDVILRDYPPTESRPEIAFGWTPHKPHVYENLQKLAEEKKPTEEYLNAQLAQMQVDFDAVAYKRKREEEYPDIATFMEAYTEKEIGGDSTKWDAYVTAYNKVRTDSPKP